MRQRELDVDMTENRDIPDHPWSYEGDVQNCPRQTGFQANAPCVSTVSFCINVLLGCEV